MPRDYKQARISINRAVFSNGRRACDARVEKSLHLLARGRRGVFRTSLTARNKITRSRSFSRQYETFIVHYKRDKLRSRRRHSRRKIATAREGADGRTIRPLLLQRIGEIRAYVILRICARTYVCIYAHRAKMGEIRALAHTIIGGMPLARVSRY